MIWSLIEGGAVDNVAVRADLLSVFAFTGVPSSEALLGEDFRSRFARTKGFGTALILVTLEGEREASKSEAEAEEGFSSIRPKSSETLR